MGCGLTACQGRLPDGRAELGTDLVPVGVVDLFEDPQGLGPGRAGSGEIARAVVHIPQTDERFGLVVTIRELATVHDGSLIVGDGLLVMAESVVNVAEAVQRGLHPVVFPEVLACGEGTLAATQRLFIV